MVPFLRTSEQHCFAQVSKVAHHIIQLANSFDTLSQKQKHLLATHQRTKKLSLAALPLTCEKVHNWVTAFADTKCLDLRSCHLLDDDLRPLSALTQLRTLHIGCNTISENGLRYIPDTVTRLHVHYTVLNTLRPLSRLKQLKTLNLTGVLFDPESLAALPASITALSCNNCYKLCGPHLFHCMHLTALTEISLQDIGNCTDDDFMVLPASAIVTSPNGERYNALHRLFEALRANDFVATVRNLYKIHMIDAASDQHKPHLLATAFRRVNYKSLSLLWRAERLLNAITQNETFEVRRLLLKQRNDALLNRLKAEFPELRPAIYEVQKHRRKDMIYSIAVPFLDDIIYHFSTSGALHSTQEVRYLYNWHSEFSEEDWHLYTTWEPDHKQLLTAIHLIFQCHAALKENNLLKFNQIVKCFLSDEKKRWLYSTLTQSLPYTRSQVDNVLINLIVKVQDARYHPQMLSGRPQKEWVRSFFDVVQNVAALSFSRDMLQTVMTQLRHILAGDAKALEIVQCIEAANASILKNPLPRRFSLAEAHEMMGKCASIDELGRVASGTFLKYRPDVFHEAAFAFLQIIHIFRIDKFCPKDSLAADLGASDDDAAQFAQLELELSHASLDEQMEIDHEAGLRCKLYLQYMKNRECESYICSLRQEVAVLTPTEFDRMIAQISALVAPQLKYLVRDLALVTRFRTDFSHLDRVAATLQSPPQLPGVRPGIRPGIRIEQLQQLLESMNFVDAHKPHYFDPTTILGRDEFLARQENLQNQFPAAPEAVIDQMAREELVSDFRSAIQEIIRKVRHRIPYMATPPATRPKELEDFYSKIEGFLCHAIQKLARCPPRAEAATMAMRFEVLKILLLGASMCGTRLLMDAHKVYTYAVLEAPYSHMDRVAATLRAEIAEGVIPPGIIGEGLNSHFFAHILKECGSVFSIPNAHIDDSLGLFSEYDSSHILPLLLSLYTPAALFVRMQDDAEVKNEIFEICNSVDPSWRLSAEKQAELDQCRQQAYGLLQTLTQENHHIASTTAIDTALQQLNFGIARKPQQTWEEAIESAYQDWVLQEYRTDQVMDPLTGKLKPTAILRALKARGFIADAISFSRE